jgi:hypothetical protein
VNWNGCGRKLSWPNFKVLSRSLPGRTEKNRENFSQDSRSSGRDFNLGHPEYEAGALTTRPRRSVSLMLSKLSVDTSVDHPVSPRGA